MRFMMLMIPKVTGIAQPGKMPEEPPAVAAMMKYSEALHKAGVLLAMDESAPAIRWALGFRSPAAKPKVTDRPVRRKREGSGRRLLDDPGEVARGVRIKWASRCPGSENEIIEVRQVLQEDEHDFPADVKAAAAGFEELQRGGLAASSG